MKYKIIYLNGSEELRETEAQQSDSALILTIRRAELTTGIDHIDFVPDLFCARVGDRGAFYSDAGTSGTVCTKFIPRADAETVRDFSFIGCFGYDRGSDGILAIVTQMRENFGTVLGVKDGNYYLYPRFFLDGKLPDTDITVEYHRLEHGSYTEMAKKYREYQLTRGGCTPLRERAKQDPRLQRSLDGIAVRVRQGWKPAPSPVEYQTPETEPPMHVACTFERVCDIADAFKRVGIAHAEFCLVGWNIGGHDGRFPQIFPADPRLGGNDGLEAAIAHVKERGYTIVAHDNATDAYSIADCFDRGYLLKHRDGSLEMQNRCWSGGRPLKICPKCQYERFETDHQPKLAALGFEGIHYIDVITILPLLACHDKAHPLSKAESAKWYRRCMQLAKQNFGGFSSESGYDFAISDVDFVLYASFGGDAVGDVPLCDEIVPFWQIAYHGIVAYNPSTFTLNYTAKGTANRLRYFELGGRPLVCFNANFAGVGIDNWMGREDMFCGNDTELEISAKLIKQMADDYELLAPERYEYIENHEKLSDGVYRTAYSNGTEVTVNYNDGTFSIMRK